MDTQMTVSVPHHATISPPQEMLHLELECAGCRLFWISAIALDHCYCYCAPEKRYFPQRESFPAWRSFASFGVSKGHDFSRAAALPERVWAFAPEGSDSD